MAKKRLPPVNTEPKAFLGPKVFGYSVGEWCPSRDGSGPAEAVAIAIETEIAGMQMDIVLRLKTPERVDELIQLLLRHKRGVWPDSP